MLLLVFNSNSFFSLRNKIGQLRRRDYIKLGMWLCHFLFAGRTSRPMDKWLAPTTSSFWAQHRAWSCFTTSHCTGIACAKKKAPLDRNTWNLMLCLFSEASATFEDCQLCYSLWKISSIHPLWAVTSLFPMIILSRDILPAYHFLQKSACKISWQNGSLQLNWCVKLGKWCL